VCLVYLGVHLDNFDERHPEMSSVTSSWRERRQAARNRRALDRAMAGAHTPEMQHELQTLAGGGNFLRIR
jgi:hypothetical protein